MDDLEQHEELGEQTAAEAEGVPEQNAVQPEVESRRQRAADLDGVREVRRFHADGVELRETSDGMLRFSGYASVTERSYEVGDFEETISRGAFKRTLGEQPDVVLLVNHEGLPLARTKSGTMTLTEDARGLRVDADLNPDDPDVRALAPKMERGDVDEMSFAFRVTDQTWNEDYTVRTVRGVTIHKGDVSVVTYGANDASTGSLLRSLELRAGKVLSAKNRSDVEKIRDMANDLLAGSEEPSDSTLVDAGAEALEAQAGERSEDKGEQEQREPDPVPGVIPDHLTRAKERLAQLRRVA